MIKMLRDFRGRASGEQYFKKDEVVELTEEFESAMIAEGVAKKVSKSVPPEVVEEPKKGKK